MSRHRVSVHKLFSAWSYTSHKLSHEITCSLTCVYPSDKCVWWFAWKLTRCGLQPSSSNTKHDVDANRRKSPESQHEYQYVSRMVPIIALDVAFAKRKWIFWLMLMTNQKRIRKQYYKIFKGVFRHYASTFWSSFFTFEEVHRIYFLLRRFMRGVPKLPTYLKQWCQMCVHYKFFPTSLKSWSSAQIQFDTTSLKFYKIQAICT